VPRIDAPWEILLTETCPRFSPPLLGAGVGDGCLRIGLYTSTARRCEVRLYTADGKPGELYAMGNSGP
jgi:hypothetical protein